MGGFWTVLTLLFEFSFFVLLMGHPMDQLLEDNDLFRSFQTRSITPLGSYHTTSVPGNPVW